MELRVLVRLSTVGSGRRMSGPTERSRFAPYTAIRLRLLHEHERDDGPPFRETENREVANRVFSLSLTLRSKFFIKRIHLYILCKSAAVYIAYNRTAVSFVFILNSLLFKRGYIPLYSAIF